jgi:outer membrane protein assembly factor BamB
MKMFVIIAAVVSTATAEAQTFTQVDDALRQHVLGKVEPKLIRDEAPYLHWHFTVPNAAPAGPDKSTELSLHIWTRGAKAVQLAAEAPRYGWWRDLELDGLTATATTLKGKVTYHGHRRGEKPGNWPTERWTLELDLTAVAGKVTGQVRGTHSRAAAGAGKEEHVRDILARREAAFQASAQPVEATVQGRVSDRQTARATDALPAGSDWTHWLGSNGLLRGQLSAGSLVDLPDKARLMWKAEAHLPNGGKGQVTRYGGFGSDLRNPSGGGASPVVANGKVYLYWYQPNGPAYVKGEEAKRAPKGYFMMSMWQTLADDHVACFDAATGERLWEAVYPLAGMTFLEGKSSMINSTPAAGEGVLVVAGGSGRVYCLDAETGHQRWQTLLPYHKGVTEQALSGKASGGRARPNAVTIASGKAYVASGRDLVALNLADGAVAWQRKGVLGSQVTPQVWRRDKVTLLLTQSDAGVLHALDAVSGEDRWTIEGMPPHGYKTINNLLMGDTLLVNGGLPADVVATTTRRQPGKQEDDADAESAETDGSSRIIRSYKISATGAVKGWELPADRYGWPHNGGLSMTALDDQRVAIFMGKRGGVSPDRPDIIVVNIADGKVLQEFKEPNLGYNMSLLLTCGDLMVVHVDINHASQTFRFFRVTPQGLELIHPGYSFGFAETSSYEVPTVYPFVEGRFIVRGAYGLYCYDFRKPSP